MHPPMDFAIVDEALYRCSELRPHALPFLATLALRTIVSLETEKPAKGVLAFCHAHDIRFVHLGVQQPWQTDPWAPITPTLLRQALATIQDKSAHPLLVLDAQGAVMGVVRKLAGWSFAGILREYRMLAGDRHNYTTEHFIESFDPASL